LVSDIALIVTAIGAFGAMYALRQSYRERLRQFEARYVERYWKLLDQLSLKVIKGSRSENLTVHDEKAIRSYIMLCEDELEMRHYGYIADGTYELWGEGIRSQLAQHYFARIWKEVENEIGTSSASQYHHLRTLMCADRVKSGDSCDPLKMGQLQRTIRGLRGLSGV
jgi:hypothetical protein